MFNVRVSALTSYFKRSVVTVPFKCVRVVLYFKQFAPKTVLLTPSISVKCAFKNDTRVLARFHMTFTPGHDLEKGTKPVL